jgi:hypothetical protein
VIIVGYRSSGVSVEKRRRAMNTWSAFSRDCCTFRARVPCFSAQEQAFASDTKVITTARR